MAKITSRQELIEYAKRTLGEPLVRVNVAPEQADDRVDEALQVYWDYHYDATEKVIVKHQITSTDIQNGFITTPENVIGVSKVWFSNVSTINAIEDLFYNASWSDILTSGGGISAYIRITKEIEELNSLFSPKIIWQFNRNSNRITVQLDWSMVKEGDYFVYEAIMAVDPNKNPEVWNDPWLKAYFTELMKKQWGMNLSKFKNVELPGGMSIDGDQLIQEANENLSKMKDELLEKYSFMGHIYTG